MENYKDEHAYYLPLPTEVTNQQKGIRWATLVPLGAFLESTRKNIWRRKFVHLYQASKISGITPERVNFKKQEKTK